MESLLFLAHRLPYPPNKGDKIRSYHLLRHLAKRYRVYLGTFVDDPRDWRYVAELESICAEVFVRPLSPMRAKLRSLRGLLTGQALTLPYYADAGLQRWVTDTVHEQGIHKLFAFSSAMAQFAPSPCDWPMLRIMDFVDVDSDKWHQYSEHKRWPMNWIYRREAAFLSRYEQRIAAEWDASLLVSETEAELLRTRTEVSAQRIHGLNNGVDLTYFSPEKGADRPYPADEKILVFTGAMDYWANVDAVTWFADRVWPQILQQERQARFYIVGSRPTAEVKRLAERSGVVVTGTVEDIRPYLAHASAAVAPLRVARGIQNKVLEAMAMGRPLVMTRAAADGIPLNGLPGITVTDEVEMFAERCLDLLRHEHLEAPGLVLRDWVCTHYDWDRNLARLDHWFAVPVEQNAEALA